MTTTVRPSSVAALVAALARMANPAAAQDTPGGPYPINTPKRLVILSEPAGVRVVRDGTHALGSTPLAITLQRSGARGFAAPVMFEALPADSTQCAQARVLDNRQFTPDTIQFFMRVCPPAPIRPDSVYASADVTDPPMRTSSPPARYPNHLRLRGIEGRAVVEFVVDTVGRVERGSARVRSASHPDFGPPALEVARASLYFPGHLDGRRVRVRVQMPIDFGIWRGEP